MDYRLDCLDAKDYHTDNHYILKIEPQMLNKISHLISKQLSRLGMAALFCAPVSALATIYPLTVTDMSGQQVEIKQAPRRIVLQDGRDIMAMALLDREEPFKRIVAWNNLLKRQDSKGWAVLSQRWPEAESIPNMGLSDHGEVNNETVIATHPDLLIAQLRAKPTLEQTGVLARFKALNIPVLFLDYQQQPIKNTVPSIKLLGKVLDREKNAKAYTDFYQQRLSLIRQTVAKQSHNPLVFIEPIAGNSESCCFTHGRNGWGDLVATAGGENIGTQLLTGASGFINPEQIITMRPEYYVMTGSKRGDANNPVLPFGYNADPKQVQARFNALLARNAVTEIPAVKAGHVAGVYHHFYNHPWNIIGVEVLAKLFYPQAMAQLEPTADYHQIVQQFTQLPDAPIVLDYQPVAKIQH